MIVINNKIHTPQADMLMDAVLKLNNREECYDFFEDLFTVKELESIAQRLTVAQMLSKNCIYNDIVAKTGASTATISRVNRALEYGTGGYACVLERMENDGVQ